MALSPTRTLDAIALCALMLLGIAGPAAAEPAARFYLRGGPLYLSPLEDSGEVVLSDVGGLASLAISEGPVEGSWVEIESALLPALTVGYVLPWAQGRLSVETLLGLPVTIHLRAGGTLAEESLAPYAFGLIPTGVPPLGSELGETKALPPVLTLVYRFLPGTRARPYLGAGLGYLYTYDSKITNPVLREVSEPSLHIDDALGAVAQAGIELGRAGRFFAALDIKYVAGLKVSATVADIHVRTPSLPLIRSTRVGDASVDVAVNPLIVHATVGARF